MYREAVVMAEKKKKKKKHTHTHLISFYFLLVLLLVVDKSVFWLRRIQTITLLFLYFKSVFTKYCSEYCKFSKYVGLELVRYAILVFIKF